MKKYLFFIAAILLLTGCDDVPPVNIDTTSRFSFPPEMSACKAFRLKDSRGSIADVFWCPNAEISHLEQSCGKGCVQKITTIQEK